MISWIRSLRVGRLSQQSSGAERRNQRCYWAWGLRRRKDSKSWSMSIWILSRWECSRISIWWNKKTWEIRSFQEMSMLFIQASLLLRRLTKALKLGWLKTISMNQKELSYILLLNKDWKISEISFWPNQNFLKELEFSSATTRIYLS